ncbi:hypothetical protein [Dyadobacter bucti]|uniref:hypothetical protein n=1 Tax=Dyadobacter bucti TaxID=2572203 RepID=UPI00110896A4|nr:hypothetical protein [Dyadobacter bucti]
MKISIDCNHFVPNTNFCHIGDVISREIEGTRNDDHFTDRIRVIEDFIRGSEERAISLKLAFEQKTSLYSDFAQNLHFGDMVSLGCFYPLDPVGSAILSYFQEDNFHGYSFFVYQKWYRSVTDLELKLVMVFNEDSWEKEYTTLRHNNIDFQFQR